MRIELPNGILDCEEVDSKTSEDKSAKGGRFRFIGARLSEEDRLYLIIIDDKAQSVVGSYKTKMKKMEHMDSLLNQIIEDRGNKIFRPFGVYCTVWISKNGLLRVPPKQNN